MNVNVGGREYQIDGIPFGSVPAWQMIKREGQPLTSEQWESLPTAEKDQLFAHVQAYINKLNGG